MLDKPRILQNEKETERLAKDFAKRIKPGAVLAFYGDLGSGKTTFIKYLAKALGIKRRLISPTFVIRRSYESKNFNFHHIDLYRIRSEKEIIDLGLLELFQESKNIVAIEWAEKMERMLPRNTIRVYLDYIDENKRAVKIKWI